MTKNIYQVLHALLVYLVHIYCANLNMPTIVLQIERAY